MSSYRQQKRIERDIKRLQADLLEVKQHRRQNRKARKVLRQTPWLEDARALQDQLDDDEQAGASESCLEEAEACPVAWELTEQPGWIFLATYSAGSRGSRRGGHFLAVNPACQQVALDRYESHWGYCETCDAGAVYSNQDIEEALGGGRPLMQVSCYTMAYRARHHIDPSMTVRQLRPDDHDYKPLACLYTAYSWYDKMTRSISSTQIDILAHWRCKYYDPETYRCIVKVQAMIRGWLFRHRVLYNPHTKIGQRFLMQGWRHFKL